MKVQRENGKKTVRKLIETIERESGAKKYSGKFIIKTGGVERRGEKEWESRNIK